MSKNWYEKGKSDLILEKPETRECCVCGKMFETVKACQHACKPCLNKDEGMFFAKWWTDRNPIVINEDDFVDAFRRATESNRVPAKYRGMKIER